MEKINENWTEPVGDEINVPDILMPLFNKVGIQIRFHTISGKNEILTIAHIVENSRIFFRDNPDALGIEAKPTTEKQKPKLSELKIGDHLLCVKDFETGIERFNSVIPDFVKGKKYEIYKIEKSGIYCSVTFRNENGIRHSLSTAFLKMYFGITDIPKLPEFPTSIPS
jgi:hypothetical protein